MRATNSFVLSAEEENRMETIAIELADPRVESERRTVLMQEVAEIAGRYQCDLRLTDD